MAEAGTAAVTQAHQPARHATTARIPELDALRAFAILAVIASHYPFFAQSLHGMPSFGWLGVELFFSLSGFLITSSLLSIRGTEAPLRTFYIRRLRRTVPPYLLTLVIGVLLAAAFDHEAYFSARWLLTNSLFLQAWRVDVISGILHLHWGRPLLWLAHHLPGPTSFGAVEPFGEHYAIWSLSIEEWFYLLWAPVVLWCKPWQTVAAGFAICMVETVLRALFWVSWTDYFSIYLRGDAVMYGALLALGLRLANQRGCPESGVRRVLIGSMLASVVGLAIIAWLIAPVLVREVRISPLFASMGLLFIGVLFASWVGLFTFEASGPAPWRAILRSPLLSWIARVSYMAYLSHLWVYAVVWRLYQEVQPARPAASSAPFLVAFASLLGTALVAQTSWMLLEKPLLQRKIVP